jgi:DNA-binding response OmpR family regulator
MAKKILILNKNQLERDMLCLCLAYHNYDDFISASNVEEGLEKVKSEKLDLVILEAGLCEIDNSKVCLTCQKIKEAAGSDVKIIIMAADNDKINAEKCRDIGADDCIRKTTDYTHLFNSIRGCIE